MRVSNVGSENRGVGRVEDKPTQPLNIGQSIIHKLYKVKVCFIVMMSLNRIEEHVEGDSSTDNGCSRNDDDNSSDNSVDSGVGRTKRQRNERSRSKSMSKSKTSKGKMREKGKIEKNERVESRKKRLTSDVWDHFKMIPKKHPNDKPRAACNYCGIDYAADTKLKGTSTLRNHIENQYK
ncbi:hypothetical protein G4B88_010229 [Cannabis sativa]|uniref:BED-type domain-containing protein n=1 Tax=Cannabis sativa TaxID=3483 RepID=A0A7J6I5E0_CANSA|nr:hypothetical protein G4B88_010229 [Cannabis sativa]